MANIRIDSPIPISDGQVITFKSPADCSTVTGLIIYYIENEAEISRSFKFADAHGNNVGGIDLFAENVLVKVILDITHSRAYVQNADTNKYIEETFLKRSGGDMGGHRITGLPLPESGSEPATKEFVENFTVEGSTYVATDDNKDGNIVLRPYVADADELEFRGHIKNKQNPHNVTAEQVGASPSNHNHDSRYLRRYELNEINIDNTDGNWEVDIAGQDNGTVPVDWVNVTQNTSGHFYTQIAKQCVSSDTTARKNAGLWYREKYKTGAWSAWSKIYHEGAKPTASEIGALPTSGGTITGPLDMYGNVITNVPWPTNTYDAANKSYVDSAVASKAPDGYGLGNNFKSTYSFSEIDNIKQNGWYKISGTDFEFDGIKASNAYLHISSYDNNWVTQTIYIMVMGSVVYVLERHCIASAWQPWGWKHPPMTLGVEYRTTELWKGKTVFVKLVSLGSMPNGVQKTVDVANNGDFVVSADFTHRTADGWTVSKHPSIDISVKRQNNGWLYVDITATGDMSGYVENYALVKYTKTTV